MPLGLSHMQEVQTPTSFGDSPPVERATRAEHLKTSPNENVHLNNVPRGAYSQNASGAPDFQKRSAKEASSAAGPRLADCIDFGLMSAAARLPATRRAQGESTSEAPSSVKLPPQFVKNPYSQGFVVANESYPSGSDSILKASEGDLLEIWHEESNGWCYVSHLTRGKTAEGCWKKEWTRNVQIETHGTGQRNGNEQMLRKLWQRRIQQTSEKYQKGCNQSHEISKGTKSMENELIREEEAAAQRACKKKSKKKSKVVKEELKEEVKLSEEADEPIVATNPEQEQQEQQEQAEKPTVAANPEQEQQAQQETPISIELDVREEGWEDYKTKKSKKKGKKEKTPNEEQEKRMDEEVPEKKEAEKKVEQDVELKADEVSAMEETSTNAEQVVDIEEMTEDSNVEHEILFGEVHKEDMERKSSVTTVPDSETKDASPSLSAASGNALRSDFRWADLSDDSDDDMSFLDNYHMKTESETPETETPSEPVEEILQVDVKESASPKVSPRSDEVESEEWNEWQTKPSRKRKSLGTRAGK